MLHQLLSVTCQLCTLILTYTFVHTQERKFFIKENEGKNSERYTGEAFDSFRNIIRTLRIIKEYKN